MDVSFFFNISAGVSRIIQKKPESKCLKVKSPEQIKKYCKKNFKASKLATDRCIVLKFY